LKGIIRRQLRKEKLVTRQFIEEQVAELREAMKALAAQLIELKVQMDRIELTIDSLRNLSK
jgi:septal ring factor EnvC (AmiA/AmiB activator)